MLRVPYFAGDTELDQLGKIFAALGTPNLQQWADHDKLPGYVEFEYTPAPSKADLFRGASAGALDLLTKMLEFDPKKRISANDVRLVLLLSMFYGRVTAPNNHLVAELRFCFFSTRAL
jgi:serine/threonine protein kinase